MQAVIVNCHDPGRLAGFWGEVLGWRVTITGDPEWAIEPPEGNREDSVVPDVAPPVSTSARATSPGS